MYNKSKQFNLHEGLSLKSLSSSQDSRNFLLDIHRFFLLHSSFFDQYFYTADILVAYPDLR